MARIIVTEFMSIDGVVEDPGGAEGFKHGGWSFAFERSAAGEKFKDDETMGAWALLLGRVTYEGFAEAWPKMQGAFADKFNSMPKFVVSSTLTDPTWPNTTVLEGEPIAAIAKLRDEAQGDLIVHGSVQLAQALLAAGLVDELRLMVFPVLLGSGKKLFGEHDDKHTMALAEAAEGGDSVLTLVYRAA